MVGRFEVSYFESDVFCPEVLFCTKCDWESNRANWCREVPGDNAIEWGLDWSEQTHVVEAHFANVLAKIKLSLLLPSMSTRVSLEPWTTGSSTNENFPGSEKLVH